METSVYTARPKIHECTQPPRFFNKLRRDCGRCRSRPLSVDLIYAKKRHFKNRKCQAQGNAGEFYTWGDGESVRFPKRREGLRPRLDLTKEQAVELQLKALQCNDDPYVDHGIEVLYRFANFDPFQRSHYFGRSLDLGQFERFRRVMHFPQYRVLLGHTQHEILSSLQVSDLEWKQRVLVVNKHRNNENGIFEFTMIQRLGGRYDAFYFTEALKRDDQDDGSVI